MPIIYPVTVDPAGGLTRMIEAGHYDWVQSDIRKLSIDPVISATVALGLVHLDAILPTSAVPAAIVGQGTRPAGLAGLLAFGAAYPDVQRGFPVIALGSLGEDRYDRPVPYLGGSLGERRLCLLRDQPDGSWAKECRFLVVIP